MLLVKFWMQISHDEQERRFVRREADRLKTWKLTDEDWRNREKRAEYEQAVEDMLERTDHDPAPWVVVEAEQKRYGRVRVLEETCRLIEAGMRRWGIDVPDAGPGRTEDVSGRRRHFGGIRTPPSQRIDSAFM